MYLTIKQQVKHLSKKDYKSIKYLCHVAKNLTNEAIYNVRQYYFDEGEHPYQIQVEMQYQQQMLR